MLVTYARCAKLLQSGEEFGKQMFGMDVCATGRDTTQQ